MNEKIEQLFHDSSDKPTVWLRIAAERLSLVRYVFLVQIEDGIPSAAHRASLEYADAVLIGWPDEDAPEVNTPNDEGLSRVCEQISAMEGYIPRFRAQERSSDIDGLSDTLIRITECVAEVRRTYQPDFPLPTFAEIRRVVQEEWDEDMDKIEPMDVNPTAEDIERLTQSDEDSQEPHKN
ncbi:phosphoribosylglycinamide synthetase [Bifidobacterium sp.]|jgi:hypothetical protein|uniref:phosphoribosylglycinamide synthetase n=1 Tax=Bifidobacterium sp. TaxID=41200 RepID=UPI0025BDC918|nr:phosphoribosylglycinamide synthetase [Bifidobacterium sp.]MCI1635632.1 phosphoribosylglycinamide synthetase [Bifidobacterium sp.]